MCLKGPARQKWDQKNGVRSRRALGRVYGNEIQPKSHEDRKRHKNRLKGVGKLGCFMSKNKPEQPHHVKVSPRGREERKRKKRRRRRRRATTTANSNTSAVQSASLKTTLRCGPKTSFPGIPPLLQPDLHPVHDGMDFVRRRSRSVSWIQFLRGNGKSPRFLIPFVLFLRVGKIIHFPRVRSFDDELCHIGVWCSGVITTQKF